MSPPVLNFHHPALRSCYRRSATLCNVSPTSDGAPTSNTRPRSPTRSRDTVKRKVAVLVAYEGSAYHGFQRNRGVLTVSDVLEEALHKSSAISDANVGELNKIQWQVAARTDRGVSAAGNLVSAKLLFNRDELAEGSAYSSTVARVNAELPEHVRVLAIKQITGSFSARSCCEGRWYEYMLPVTALRDGSTKSLEDLNEILKLYEGSHLFHNFTVGVDHSIPPRVQARRYVTEARCDLTPLELDDSAGEWTRWARIRVKGQSFMLHQIRKMVSLALMSHLGYTERGAIYQAMDPKTLVNVAPAPATGLFLDCCHFGWYNERQKQVLSEPLDMTEFDSDREAFVESHILPSIGRRMREDESLQDYFRTIERHPARFE